MKKKLLLFSTILLTSFTPPLCSEVKELDDVSLTAERVRNDHLGNPYPKVPIHVPSASLDNHTFYINGDHPDYLLQLVDIYDEETVVYEVSVPNGTNSVTIPSTYNGEYIIQLLWGDWRFWGVIVLE